MADEFENAAKLARFMVDCRILLHQGRLDDVEMLLEGYCAELERLGVPVPTLQDRWAAMRARAEELTPAERKKFPTIAVADWLKAHGATEEDENG